MKLTDKTNDQLTGMLEEIHVIYDASGGSLSSEGDITDQQWELLENLEDDIADEQDLRHPPKPPPPRDPKACSFVGVSARKMKPTLGHRPAIWENILGTVYALSPQGECKYFDYNYEAAHKFAGLDTSNKTGDNRVSKPTRRCSWVKNGASYSNPRRNQTVLWVLS